MEKVPKLTKKDFEEMEKEKEMNWIQRMQFIEFHAEYLKKTPNRVWSRQQAKFLEK